MKDQFEMYGVKQNQSNLQAPIGQTIEFVLCNVWQIRVDKCRLYCHLQHTISKDYTILQGKFDKLIVAKVLLRSCFFVDALSTANQFSLTTQKIDIDLISIVGNVESTKNSYEKLLRKFEFDADKVLSFPTLKSLIKEIESNDDGEPVYQELS